jgi:hypothetical protein
MMTGRSSGAARRASRSIESLWSAWRSGRCSTSDDHPEVALAKQRAADHDILLAISNPCFELWAYLHFADQAAHIERGKLRAELRKHLPQYDKELELAKLHAGYDDAVRRAQALEVAADSAGRTGRNPTTGVYRLTEAIRTR